MLTIRSGGMPQAAVAALAAVAAGTYSTTERFDVLKGVAGVRDALRDEQANRCAYCERVLPREDGKTKIEHFHPRSAEFRTNRCTTESGAKTREASVVEWRNLLLVCHGEDAAEKTCDTRKRGTDVCAKIHNPKRAGLQTPTQVECDYCGHISATTGGGEAQKVLDGVLNLNDEQLCAARKRLWSELTKQMTKAINPKVKGPSRAALRERFIKNAQVKEFGSVYLTLAKRL